jgi:2-polyprenyl-6-methoxyphenol hydroxylase-like FAD-dependent oxidoreductase
MKGSTTMSGVVGHALVVGGSISGLLAARVLSDVCEKVTVVERDSLCDDTAKRKGVPHGGQPHVLLAQGARILSDLFPGFVDDLMAAGAPAWTDGDLAYFDWSIGGHLLVRSGRVRDPAALALFYPSRWLLEQILRRRVAAISNVSVNDGYDVVGLTSDPNRHRITGVRVADLTGQTFEWTADLVVDATGRGSRTPVFLHALGYDRPCEEQINVGLAYTSQPLRFRSDMRPHAVIASFPKRGRQSGYSLWANEDDTWMFGLATIGGAKPPAERSGMLDFVEEFAPAELTAKLRSAEPLGEVARHSFPSSRWRRYDKMRRIPEGLIVVGDAVCSFNPIYGQGITVAALEAVALRDCLGEGTRDLPSRFFRSAVKTIGVAWLPRTCQCGRRQHHRTF